MILGLWGTFSNIQVILKELKIELYCRLLVKKTGKNQRIGFGTPQHTHEIYYCGIPWQEYITELTCERVE